MYKKKKIIAVIPARLGSKRLKKKNIINIDKNKCLLDFTYKACKKSKFLDRFVLSTESKKISSIGKKIGFEVPFLRPKKFSQDKVSSEIPVIHTVKNLNESYDFIVLLQPTSPLRTGKDIDSAIKKIIDLKYQSLISISKSEKKKKFLVDLNNDNTIEYQSLIKLKKKVKKNNLLISINKNTKIRFKKKKNKYYFLNGSIFIAKNTFLLKNKTFISKKTGYHLIPENRSIDIDTNIDLKKFKRFLKK